MQVVPCAAPVGAIEPAPLTSLFSHTDAAASALTAFWTEDDRYLVRADNAAGTTWFAIDADADAEPVDLEAKRALGALMADIIPMGGGRVLFPVGSTGRTVFRVWRGAKGADRNARTRILGVRVGRSRRRPA